MWLTAAWGSAFEDVTEKKRAGDIATRIIDFLDSYECNSKIIAQCYDGAPVMALGIKIQAWINPSGPVCALLYTHT